MKKQNKKDPIFIFLNGNELIKNLIYYEFYTKKL